MQNLIHQFSTRFTPSIRMSIIVVVIAVLIIIVVRLLVLLATLIRDGITTMEMNALMTRIRHCKNIENRVQLIDTYNNRIHQLSERGRPRMPKLIKVILTLVILAALAVCALSIVMPDQAISRRAVDIYTNLERSLAEENKTSFPAEPAEAAAEPAGTPVEETKAVPAEGAETPAESAEAHS